MILDALFPSNSLENPSTPIGDYDLTSQWGGLPMRSSSAGVTVTTDKALGFHALYRGVDLVGNLVGKLPIYISKKVDGGAERDTSHPNYRHLLYRPSPEMSAIQLKKTAEVHRMLDGNAYIFCRRSGSGQIIEFVLLNPKRTWPVRNNGTLYYVTYRTDGGPQLMRREDVIHLKGLGYDGLVGYPITHIGRESLASGIAIIEYSARFFRNGAVPTVVLEVPNSLTPEAKADLAKNWNQLHRGLSESHKTAVLSGGAKVNVLSAKADESQLIEQKKFSIIEASNLTGVPPHRLGDGSRAAYNSLEQENRSLIDDTLDWRLVDWELELYDKVLTEKQKADDSYEISFDREQLLRADLSAMGSYLSSAIGGPWMTVDEGRSRMGLNERPGEEGDVLYSPVSAAPKVDETATDATDGTTPDAGLQVDLTLNGAQVEAARQILIDLAAGLIAPEAAIELLVGIGIPRDKAQSMVRAQEAIDITQADVEQKPGASPAAPAAPTAPATPEQPSNVVRAHSDLLNRSVRKMAARLAKNAQRLSRKPAEFWSWLDDMGGDHRGVMVEEFTGPLALCDVVLGICKAPDSLADQLLDRARADLLEISGQATAEGIEGAVSEWAGRFSAQAADSMVDEIFKR